MNGKILILFLLVINLFGVTAKVDKQNVIEGDNVAFSITASGGNVVFPKIDNIDGDNIEAVSSSQNISIINGNYKKTITKTYVFTPSHSLVIPSYPVIVDGKKEYTNPIKINIVKDTKTTKDFKLEIKAKKEAIVGYPNIVTIRFYQKTNVKVDSVAIEMPKGDFKLVQIGNEKYYYKGIYQIIEVKYELIPLKEGKIDFKVKLKLGFRKQSVDAFGFIVAGMRYKTLQKEINITAKKVYDGLVGDFNISLNVDKTKVDSNQPVNATLVINGYGYLNSLGDIKLQIPDVTIYDNKAKIFPNKYVKKYVIVGDKNYTIPSLSLTFYSIKDKKVKTITTKPINIEVIGQKSPSLVVNNTQKCKPQIITNTKIEYKTNYIFVILALIVGIFIGYFIKFSKKEIKLPKNLYKKLLPYADDPKVKEILNKLYKKEKLTAEEKNYLKNFLRDK